MHNVYKLCTVSTDYTRVNVYVHSVYKLRTVSTDYAYTRMRRVYVRGVYVYTCTYTRIRVYTFISALCTATAAPSAGPLAQASAPSPPQAPWPHLRLAVGDVVVEDAGLGLVGHLDVGLGVAADVVALQDRLGLVADEHALRMAVLDLVVDDGGLRQRPVGRCVRGTALGRAGAKGGGGGACGSRGLGGSPPCVTGCCFFTGPWTVTRSSLRMLRRVAAFCRPLRPVPLLVSFPRSRSPVVGVLGLC